MNERTYLVDQIIDVQLNSKRLQFILVHVREQKYITIGTYSHNTHILKLPAVKLVLTVTKWTGKEIIDISHIDIIL